MPYKDPDQRRAYYREFKRTPGKKRSDKFYTAARHANQRARRYGVPGTITTADARAVLDGAVCVYCGSTDSLGIDHRKALAVGGHNVPANLVAACHPCNASKFRGDRPGRWSRDHDRCVDCGSTDRPHGGRGRCQRCYQRLK